MNHLTTLLFAFGAPPTSDAAGARQPTWVFGVQILLMLVVFYFILIRPQTKAKKEHEKLLASLKTGDRVTMSSGILGIIANIKDKDVVVVKIADNVKIEVLKSSITSVTKEEVKEETK